MLSFSWVLVPFYDHTGAGRRYCSALVKPPKKSTSAFLSAPAPRRHHEVLKQKRMRDEQNGVNAPRRCDLPSTLRRWQFSWELGAEPSNWKTRSPAESDPGIFWLYIIQSAESRTAARATLWFFLFFFWMIAPLLAAWLAGRQQPVICHFNWLLLHSCARIVQSGWLSVRLGAPEWRRICVKASTGSMRLVRSE